MNYSVKDQMGENVFVNLFFKLIFTLISFFIIYLVKFYKVSRNIFGSYGKIH